MTGTGIIKHSVSIAGHKTSISLEEIFWITLKDIASRRDIPMRVLITEIDADRQDMNLSSAIRVFVLRDALTAAKAHEQYG